MSELVLSKIRVRDFEAFKDSGDVYLKRGINLIVGPNNSGKTSLLRCLRQDSVGPPHREPGSSENPYQSRLERTFFISGAELWRRLSAAGEHLNVPAISTNSSEIAGKLKDLFQRDIVELEFISLAGGTKVDKRCLFGMDDGQNNIIARVKFTEAGNCEVMNFFVDNGGDQFTPTIYGLHSSKRFYFDAERFSVGASQNQYVHRLYSNASNLAAVLSTLQGTRGSVFGRLVGFMCDIFPTIGNISVGPDPNNQADVKIFLWPTKRMDEVDLSFSLADSGTGIGQVLAILTAVSTVRSATIIIDEINSFVHPAACKKLLSILSEEYKEHTYIISTHAAEVITHYSVLSIIQVSRRGYNSTLRNVELNSGDNIRVLAHTLGISMTDVFAAEKILWVEGKTEEICFEYILKREEVLPHVGILISSVTTGDFIKSRRDRRIVYEIYEKLSKASAPLVEVLAFSFDSELLTDNEKQIMTKESGNKVRFLPRRHFECFLLNAAAILEFISERDIGATASLNVGQVEAQLRALAPKYTPPVSTWADRLDDDVWLRTVDAANLIDNCCLVLSDSRVRFHKGVDSLSLLRTIMEESRSSVQELVEYVTGLIAKPS